nr:peroxynitrite isomerase THAP4-like [Dermacentor andersoni]
MQNQASLLSLDCSHHARKHLFAMAPRRKTGNYCCVVNCHNSNVNTKGLQPPVTFYRFPTKWYEKGRRQMWITAVRRTNADGSPWSPTETTRICSRHFVGNCKSNCSQHPSYVPTIFPAAYKTQTPDPEVAQRWKRHSVRAARSLQNPVEQAVPQSTPQVYPQMQDQDSSACLDVYDTLASDAKSPEMPLTPISDDPQPSAGRYETQQAQPLTQADAACQTEPEPGGNLVILLSATNGSEASTQVSHIEQCDKVTGTDGSWESKFELTQNEIALQDICGATIQVF